MVHDAARVQKEGFGCLRLRAFEDVAIVVDASESAWEHREDVLRAVAQLLERLPAGAAKQLYFLSNPRRYDASRLERNAVRWWEQNRLRGSFLAPVLQEIEDSKVVVIGTGRIYDLDDWQETKWNSSLYFLRIGESLKGESKIGEEVEELSHLVSCLCDTIVSVEISGEGFMPYYWSNPQYRLLVGRRTMLVGSNLENPSVSVGFYGTDVNARVVTRSNDESRPLETAEYHADDSWKQLTQEECVTFRKALRGQEFACPVCGKEHPASCLRCDRNSILGAPIYPSLGKKKGFVFFKDTSDEVAYKFHPVNAVKIGDGVVAVAVGSKAMVHQYDVTESRWMEKGHIEPYHALEDTYIALV